MGLLTVAAAYFVVRAVEDNRWPWYLLAGTALGLGFMAKQIQAFLPIPALVLAILLFGAGGLRSRLLKLLGALTALVVSGGWWMAVVDLTPAGNRPYVGGSALNSVLELTLDYNGLARFLRFSADPKSGRAVPANDQDVYDGGLGRLFNANFAPEGAWLLFSALICALALVLLWRQSRVSRHAAGLTTIGVTWLVSVYAVLSFMGTMTHTYYVFSIAAPIAIVVPLGLYLLWNQRKRTVPRLIGAILLLGTGYVGFRIFQFSDDWGSVPSALICATCLAMAGWLWAGTRNQRIATLVVVTLATVMAPVATNIITLSTPQAGTNPLSGPVSNNPEALSAHLEGARRGDPPLARDLGFGVQPSADVTALLKKSGTSEWAAATYTAQNAAQYQLASQRPVIALGGWLGNDPAPTFEQFRALVEGRRIGYFIWQQVIVDEVPLGSDAVAITDWVQSNFEGENSDGVRIYDLRD
jgi:4-amino-4-deoxy-L-arabinose transferase-like glycosyltransferase